MWDPKETIESVGLGRQERKRPARVADAIRMELSILFLQKVRDQQLSDVRVTEVTMTDDLKSARILYTVPGSEKKQKKVAEALKRAAGFMRSHLARVLNMRYTPSLLFIYDTKAEKVEEMEKLFQ
ncbi:MAG: 30S ribosome-binding factor RbfA, partial [Proteobacteria bacterium]|nr:30S ribosome-binding factor RbfA [Pseudomonadota bacterium]